MEMSSEDSNRDVLMHEITFLLHIRVKDKNTYAKDSLLSVMTNVIPYTYNQKVMANLLYMGYFDDLLRHERDTNLTYPILLMKIIMGDKASEESVKTKKNNKELADIREVKDSFEPMSIVKAECCW